MARGSRPRQSISHDDGSGIAMAREQQAGASLDRHIVVAPHRGDEIKATCPEPGLWTVTSKEKKGPLVEMGAPVVAKRVS